MQRPIGSRVSVALDKYPGVWTVEKNGPTNATLRQDGNPRRLRCPHTLLTDPEQTVTTPGGNTAVVTAVPVPEYYALGEFVRVTAGNHAGIWVTIADKGGDRVNLAKPGGDSDRYLRMPRALVKRVPLAEAVEALR